MEQKIYDKLSEIGFTQFSAVEIEFPTQTFIRTIPAGANQVTNILVYYKTNRDFAVIFPQMNENKWVANYYGNTSEVKGKVESLIKEIERGEI